MKFSHLLATAGLVLPLGVIARGLPRYHVFDDEDEDDGTPSLKQYTRMTSFIIGENGVPQVECREVSSRTESSTIRRKDGSRSTAYSTRFVNDQDQEDDDIDVELLTWPAYSPIWPVSEGQDDVHAAVLLFLYPCFFSVNRGLVLVRNNNGLKNVSATDDDDDDDNGMYVFGPDNGDDWFYFEDNASPSARSSAKDSLTVETLSGGNTQILGITHTAKPSYKKLHDGPCRYSGVEVMPEKGKGRKGRHIDLNLQIEEL